MRLKKLFFLFLAAVLALTVFVGCGKSSPPSDSAEPKDGAKPETAIQGNWWEKFGEPQYGGTINVRAVSMDPSWTGISGISNWVLLLKNIIKVG